MSISLQDQYDKIYRYCYFKLNNKEMAEDLTQETFLRYFSQKSYIDRGKPLAYLYTIAKNLCIDYYRNNDKVQELKEDLLGKDDIFAIETRLTLKQAVSLLSHDLQELLLLRFVNELAIGEIANILGVSRFTVSRRLNKALSQLETLLRKEDFT